MPDIFVSYRRDDSSWSAGRINDYLMTVFGADRVFFDTVTIEPGADFHEVLGASVGSCRVLLAIIGPGWVTALERDRADGADFVCIEIAEALSRDVRVIPVLIDGAEPPSESILPPVLKPLARRHAVEVTPTGFRRELAHLAAFLDAFLGERPEPPRELDREPARPRSPAIAHHQGAALEVAVGSGSERRAALVVPGDGQRVWFRDRSYAPEMVVVPAPDPAAHRAPVEAGRFGLAPEDTSFGQPFAIGRHAVTVGEFLAFVDETGHPTGEAMFTFEDDMWLERRGRSFRDPGFEQSAHHPVVGVTWADAVAFCQWLSETTGFAYRLPTALEWEHCCRAGTGAPFWWGDDILPTCANYDENSRSSPQRAPTGRPGTAPVDAFEANPWGLYQMHGNVWEWCEEDDGRGPGADGLRILCGGSWMSVASLLHAGLQNREHPATAMSTIGFRVARTLDPANHDKPQAAPVRRSAQRWCGTPFMPA